MFFQSKPYSSFPNIILVFISIESIVSAWLLIPPLANHIPAIFSLPPGTEKLNKSPQADEKPR